MTAQKIARRDELLASVRQSEKRLAEIGTLKKHIINYSKTRPIYEEYRKPVTAKSFWKPTGKKSKSTKQPRPLLMNWV